MGKHKERTLEEKVKIVKEFTLVSLILGIISVVLYIIL